MEINRTRAVHTGQGIAVGAIAMLFLGFVWPGDWDMASTVEGKVKKASDSAVVVALAPICMSQFNAKPEAAPVTADLKSKSSYQQGDIVEKTGAAIMPGSEKAIPGVAQACAELIVKAAQ